MAAGYKRPAAGHEHLLEVLFVEKRLDELAPGLRRLGQRVFEELMSRGIALGGIRSGIAPGRAALAVRGLPASEPDKERLRLGPLVKGALADGRPTPELLAFAAAEGRSVRDLDRIYTERGHRFAAIEVMPGRPVGEAVAGLLAELLAELRTARRGPSLPEMSALLSLSSGQPAPFEVQGLEAGGETLLDSGERYRPGSAEDYFRELPLRGVALYSLAELEGR
jgi:hypothetical protein